MELSDRMVAAIILGTPIFIIVVSIIIGAIVEAKLGVAKENDVDC